jgi:hypothetical protein
MCLAAFGDAPAPVGDTASIFIENAMASLFARVLRRDEKSRVRARIVRHAATESAEKPWCKTKARNGGRDAEFDGRERAYGRERA